MELATVMMRLRNTNLTARALAAVLCLAPAKLWAQPVPPSPGEEAARIAALRGYQERFLEARAELDALADATGRDL